ncbi:MAG: hypothetical protein Q8L06_03450, partial [Pseudohongiella sp.]|nr:hypothetical protein [Pseudohongiella sp.]
MAKTTRLPAPASNYSRELYFAERPFYGLSSAHARVFYSNMVASGSDMLMTGRMMLKHGHLLTAKLGGLRTA